MGREVAVKTEGARAVSIDLNNLNYDLAKNALERVMKRAGVSAHAKKFPGKMWYTYKGAIQSGFGENAVRLSAKDEIVLNVPNHAECYSRKTERDGKEFTEYTDVALPFAGQDLDTIAPYDSLPDKDETDENDKPIWKQTLVIPVRMDPDTEEVDHLRFNSVTGVNAFTKFMIDVLPELQMRPGKLPLVKLSTKQVSSDITKTERGKEKKVKVTYDVPVITLAGWVDATEADNGGMNGVNVTGDGEDADVGEVETKGRKVSTPKASVKAEPAPKGKAKSRKSVDVDDI